VVILPDGMGVIVVVVVIMAVLVVMLAVVAAVLLDRFLKLPRLGTSRQELK
jgi:uncharacterized membrane protein YdbT with pleckstrin-like domain